MLVVGGGVVGAGAALDAATRGLKVALVEARDFASGTSSRSSKLIHGGLRYLEQLEFELVREALRSGACSLQRLAPHLVRPVPFLFPLPPPGLGAAVRRARAWRCTTRWRWLVGHGRGMPLHRHLTRERRAAAGARAARGRAGRRDPVLRRPGRRRPAT